MEQKSHKRCAARQFRGLTLPLLRQESDGVRFFHTSVLHCKKAVHLTRLVALLAKRKYHAMLGKLIRTLIEEIFGLHHCSFSTASLRSRTLRRSFPGRPSPSRKGGKNGIGLKSEIKLPAHLECTQAL